MNDDRLISRREALRLTGAGFGATAMLGWRSHGLRAATPFPLKGRLKQSVARWCMDKIPFEELAKAAAAMGLKAIDLVDAPEEWAILKKHGLVCTMTRGGAKIPDGFNRKENHDELE